MPRSFLFLCLLVSMLMSACSTSNHGKNPPYEKENSKKNVLTSNSEQSDIRTIKDIPQFEETEGLMAPGFLFSLSHPSDAKLQGTFRAQFDGQLRLPYGVKINVTGLTFEELRQQVLKAYTSFFQRGAQDVNFVLQSRDYYVEVRGFVKRSGTYLVKRKESIDKVIDMAGGLKGDIKQDFFMANIKQQNTSYAVSLNQYYDNNVLGTSFTWTGGDVLFINLANEDSATNVTPTIEVLGGVASPGKTLYKEGANLFYYLGKRGGVIPNLGYEEAFVIRKIGNRLERINFNMTDVDTIPSIKPGDTILLTAERRTVMDRVWDRTTQIATILTTIAFLILAF